uniref:Uncharacterized protein n=1 Tax=Heterosigma akashiwo TaxID=2829 RepID=A0A7S3YMF4_HETAK
MDEQCGSSGWSLFEASCDDKFEHYNACHRTCSADAVVPTKAPWNMAPGTSDSSSPTDTDNDNTDTTPTGTDATSPTDTDTTPTDTTPTDTDTTPTGTDTAATDTTDSDTTGSDLTSYADDVDFDDAVQNSAAYEGGCETAVAYGDQTFIDLGITNSRWGWSITLDGYTLGTSVPIYAAAGGNDVSKGWICGALTYSYDAETGCIRAISEPRNDWYFTESHLWAGETPPDTTAFGNWPDQHTYLDNEAKDEYSFCLDDPHIPAYLALHFVACHP